MIIKKQGKIYMQEWKVETEVVRIKSRAKYMKNNEWIDKNEMQEENQVSKQVQMYLKGKRKNQKREHLKRKI